MLEVPKIREELDFFLGEYKKYHDKLYLQPSP